MASAFHTGAVAGDARRTGPAQAGDRLAAGHAGAVAPAGGLGQVDRRAAGGGGAGRRGAGPGEDQGVLALEEAVAAHAAGGAALGGVLA